MEAKKEKIDKKVAPVWKTRKPQIELPKTSWQISAEDREKSRWNPCALYF